LREKNIGTAKTDVFNVSLPYFNAFGKSREPGCKVKFIPLIIGVTYLTKWPVQQPDEPLILKVVDKRGR